MQFFSADATIFKKKKLKIFLPPQNCDQKLLIIPLDQEFLVQQVFAFCNWDSVLVWFFLIFEVIKLCRMKIESPDSNFRDTSLQTTYLFTYVYVLSSAISAHIGLK